jgi:hypothetical protein
VSEGKVWNDEVKVDGGVLHAAIADGLRVTRQRCVVITDEQGQVRMSVSLLGWIIMAIVAPILLLVVTTQVLVGQRAIAVVKPGD